MWLSPKFPILTKSLFPDILILTAPHSKWNNRTDLSQYYPDNCALLSGNVKEFFPPDSWDTTTLTYFSSDLCRPLSFTYQKMEDVDGYHGYKYVLTDGFLANSTFNNSNSCYNPYPDLGRLMINAASCHHDIL